ncbi:MAG: YihY/virulence factor BrkB family protein [Algoriphagus sp.]|nr:YihY/virulence factor BrkB family protein [Algoriphagus sp.]
MVRKSVQFLKDLLRRQAKRLQKFHFGDPDKNLYEVGKVFIYQFQKDDISERAGSMAFSFTLALFPLLLFVLNTIPYLQDFFPYITTDNILLFVQEILPGEIYSQLENTILDIISKPRQSLLSIGFFFALFSSSQGVISMMDSFNSVYQTKDDRSFLRGRLISVAIVFVLVVTILIATTVMIIGNILIGGLENLQLFNSNFMIFLFSTLKFLVLLSVFYFTTAFIFRFAPAVHDKWHFFSTGSQVAGLLITAAFYLFSYYLNNFASYNKLYGSIGTLMGLMLWLFITSLIILISFEVNVTMDLLDERKKNESLEALEKRNPLAPKN